jgi:LDH2 family malate/lactate/ureidoglycolate dehydrogenase
MRVVEAEELRAVIDRLLTAAGCGPDAAAQTADVLLEGDLRGYAFQGVFHLPAMLRALRDGQMNPAGAPRVLREREATALVDGDGGLPPVAGLFAADLAVAKSRRAGSCAVGLVNCDPLYLVGYFGERIARAGCVGILASVGRPRVHPPGGIERILGTNPVVIAVPAQDGPPVLLDFATSALAYGAVVEARLRGQQLPDGVAIGPEGRPTRDPTLAVEGALTPFGGHKGFGLNLCAGLLAGPLIGAAVGKAMAGAPICGRRTNRGDLMIALDPCAFGEAAAFRRAVSAHLAEVKASRRAPGVSDIRIPGERSFDERERRLREGVPVYEAVWTEIARAAAELNVRLPGSRAVSGGP